MRWVQFGRFRLATARDGLFRLDGGAMFGIVPRVVWERVAQPDERHRIQLSLNPLVIEGHGKRILVDTGIGGKRDAKWGDMFGVDHRWDLAGSLRALGLALSDIDYVVPSHLHFDHMGGATVLEGGRAVPTFPRATYLVQTAEWDAAHSDNPRSRGSYLREDFDPLEGSGRLKLLRGDEEIVPGVRVSKTVGHTPGHQIVYVESEGKTAVYMGDLMPTSAHVKPAWCMAYDCFPLDVARTKAEMLERAAAGGWLLVLDHDLHIAMASVTREKDQFRLEPVVSF